MTTMTREQAMSAALLRLTAAQCASGRHAPGTCGHANPTTTAMLARRSAR